MAEEERMVMTPLMVQMLLHFHTCRAPFPNVLNAPQLDAIDYFLAQGAIEENGDTVELHIYQTTELGAAWVEAICQVRKPRLAYLDQYGNILS